MSAGGIKKISENRRRVLKLIAVGSTYATCLKAYPFAIQDIVRGYGPDPNMINPKISWKKILSHRQVAILRVLGDIVIPADTQSPAASSLDLSDFINEWVSAPYPVQRNDKQTLVEGMTWLDKKANVETGIGYVELSADKQLDIFDGLAKQIIMDMASVENKQFFERLVFLFVGAYYTTKVGMDDIGYAGNVPLLSFEGPPLEVLKLIEGVGSENN